MTDLDCETVRSARGPTLATRRDIAASWVRLAAADYALRRLSRLNAPLAKLSRRLSQATAWAPTSHGPSAANNPTRRLPVDLTAPAMMPELSTLRPGRVPKYNRRE